MFWLAGTLALPGLARGSAGPPAQQVGVRFEPAFSFAEIGAEAGDLTPEPPGMVHFLEVGQFVQDEVVANGDRGLDQTPVEGDGTAARAGAPAGTLVAHRDAEDRQAMLSCQFEHPGRQLLRRQTPEMPLDSRTEVSGWICNVHNLGTAADQMGLTICPWLKPDRLAAKEDFCSSQPGFRLLRAQRLAKELPFEPGNVALREPFGLGERAAARDRDPGGAVRPEAEDIAPGAPVAYHPEPHSPRAGEEPMFVPRGSRPGAKEPFKLHLVI
jgi:hypothetical protein